MKTPLKLMPLVVLSLAAGLLINAPASAELVCDIEPADTDASIMIELTRSEREVLNLAIPGYIEDLKKESDGAGIGNFPGRKGGLDIFIFVTVPCIQKEINENLEPDESVIVEFNSFERVAVQIMMAIWNPRDGVMAHHLRGCRKSQELRNADEFGPGLNLCGTFTPLAEAAKSLFDKVSQDQPG